jgi:hypothetical protein
MPSFKKAILGALGVKPKAAPPKPKPAHKSLLPPSQRAALIAEAMDLYRRIAPGMRGVVDEVLAQLKTKPPNPNDEDSMRRLLGIHQAHRDLRRLMNHRDRRYLVLARLRELLEQKPLVAPPGVKKLVVKR